MADYSLIEGALQRGYSMDEIADKLAQAEGFDPSAIRARGYGAEDIIGRLGYVKPEEVKPEKGFIGNVLDQAVHGVKTAYQGLLSAPGIYAGNPDAERIAGTIQAEQSHEKPKEMREAEAAFADVSKRQSDVESVYGEDSGYMDSIGKIMDMLVTTGKEIVTNPKGMAYEMASQSGNMVAPMVGAYAGGKTGAVTGALLGPKGAVAGGVVGAGAGGFAGSHVMEQSGEFRGKVAERLSELGLEPTAENVSAIFQDKAWLDKTLEETRDKATGTAVTDGVLAAIGGLAVNAPIRAAQKTARAQLGATATAKQVSDAAADILASQPKWQKVAPHLKAGAIGWGGEPISEAAGQQYGYGHVDYGDVGMEAFAAAGEGIGSVYAAAKGMRTKPTLPANVTPPPSITSASSTDDAIKAFKDEVETASPAPRGSFSGMDDLAGLIESERSDLGKRRVLLAQQQQEARDMEAEFSGLVKDEQIDQSYRLNDAQKQRDAERTREGGYDLALQQREEQQGRTVEQLAAASEAQGFGNEEPTAMQLAMQQAQQKALDNEFSGLLKQERASLNEMRANVKRVAGVPVEQISTPQLEEIAQSEAHPNTKMAAVAALNDRHDAIQQERERLMQLRETRLEKQSNQPEQGAQHGAESHGTDGQVATPSVAGGGANVSGGGFDAAMVAADRGMRETASAGAAVSSGGQVGAVPVADQPTNVRALTENGKPSASWVIRNKETGESLFETFDRKKVDALNTEKYEAVPILEYLQSLNKPRAESPNDAQIVNVRQHTTRRKPASNTIAQAIINLGGISTSLKTDILGDASIKTRPGLFTTNGTGDLGEIAAMLSSGFGFSQIDLNDPTDNSGAKQLADLIARSVNGETILNEEGMILAQQAEEEAMHREDINNKAREFGIKPSGKGRPFSKVEAEVLKLVEMRLEKEIYRAGEEMQAAREFALKYFTQEEVDAICDKAVDQLGSDASILEIYQGITKAIYEAINENKGRNRDRAANSEAEGIDRESRRSGLPEAEDRRPAGEGEGAAREGQGAEVTPEFGLIGQTEEEAIAEEQARRDEDQRKADEDRAEKRRIDAEAVARRNEQNANTVASDNFQLGQSSQEVRRMVHSGMVDMFGNPTTEADDGNPARKMDEAARQAANISDDHANIPNMDGVRAAAQQILDAIEQDDLADYGLRVIPGEFEGDIAVGDVLPPSRVWEDGRETDDELLGTSTVEVGSLTLDGVLKSLNGLGAAGKPGPNGYYFGDRVVLVKGDRVSGGDDSGESLLKNASVVGVWRKASKGLSSILPNEAVAPTEGPAGETTAMFTPDGRTTVAADRGLSNNSEESVDKESQKIDKDPIAAVKATLDAAGVTGTDRTSTIAAVRRGDLTPEDVAEAHPAIAENSERVNTEDAGEELSYNRRNRSGSLKWSDIKDQEAALRIKEATKAKVYPKPDYTALADEIGPVKAHLVKQVYDHIAATPQTGRNAPTDAQLEAYIDAVNRIMDATLAWAKDAVFESQWRPTANGKTLLDTIYPNGWRAQHRDEVILLGGNRYYGGIQLGYDEIKRAEREIAKGWPGKREAWQTQGYKVVETAETAKLQEGRSSGNKVYYIEVGGRYFDSAPSKADGEKMIAEMQPWLLLNKQGRIVSQHQSEEQAVEAARNATKRGGSGGISDKGIAVENAERVGPARRMEGENVTSDQLKETFGFRGVNFGTWMKGKANDGERQLHLNHAYDAFLDLAEIIGVPPKAMSLNGMLGLAIGAQGNGKYAAHFVPGVNEINLTRTSGAGSLAHEFGHALDHYFARLGGLDRQAEPFLTEHTSKPAQGELRPEILDKFDSIVKEMNKRKMTPEEYEAEHLRNVEKLKTNVDSWTKAIRRDFESAAIQKVTIEDGKAKREKAISKLDALIERIRDKDLGDGRIAIGRYESASPVVMEIRELYKETFGRQMPKNNILGLQSNIDSLVYATSKRDTDNSHTPQVSTDYAKNALALDKDKGGKPYWSTNLEKFARAFDAFVTDTLDAKAAKNSYLSHAGREGATVPAGEERKAINEAFKALVDAIETKETDSGVAMFSRADGNQPWYFSALEDGIRNAKLKTQPASQWVAWIRSQQQFKKEEVEWSGILDHLASLGKERVTSGDLAQWVAENGVRVEEVVLGEDRLADLQKQLDEINDRYNAIIDEHGVTVQELPAAAKKEIDDLTVRHDEIADRIADTYHTDYATKHASGNLVLPGGTDHREIVLTVPSVDPYNESDSTHYGDVGKGKQIAWTRVNTRTDADGNKVLFVEEIQSQRNQHGRKKGFVTNDLAQLNSAVKEYEALVVRKINNPRSMTEAENARIRELQPIVRGQGLAGKGVPPAPFVSTKDGKPTDSYIPLTLKRLIAYAVDSASDSWRMVSKPYSAGEELQNNVNRELAGVIPLEFVDAPMLSALKNDKVRQAVIELIPVDVVDILTANGIKAEDVFNNRNVFSNPLPAESRATVAAGVLSALELVGTRLRAALLRVLTSESGRGDKELTSAIRAVDLSGREVYGLLSTSSPSIPSGSEAISVFSGSSFGPARSSAKPAIAVSDLTREGGKLSTAELTSALNRHNYLLKLNGLDYSSTYDSGYQVISWVTGDQTADRYDLSKQIGQIEYYKNKEGKYQVSATALGDNRTNVLNAAYAEGELADVVGKDVAEKIISEQGSDGEIFRPGHPDGSKVKTKILRGLDLKVGGGWTASMYGDASGLNAQGKPSMIAQAARKLGAEVSSIQLGRKIDPYIKNDGGVYVVIDDISGDIISPEYSYESQAQSRLEQIESERTQQPSFPITDQMREQASKGMPLFQRDKAQAGTSAYPLSKDQSAAERLNRNLADHFKDSSWENAYVQRNLPDSFNAVAEAARAAFGTRVVGITATEQRFNQFNGVNLYRTAYVNLGAKPSFVNIAGHEIYHSLEKERPDLHQWFVAQARKHFRNFDEYHAKLNALVSANEQPYTREKAESELLADFTGDALADPKFLAQLAEADGSKFRRLLNAVAGWLKLAGEKLTGKNLGSSAYFNDVNELRKFLNRALIAYSSNKPIDRILALDEPRFMTAWHGSPHDHDGFDSSKIGTGEGAQAYGWGHYFAGSREVAEYYRDTLSGPKNRILDRDIKKAMVFDDPMGDGSTWQLGQATGSTARGQLGFGTESFMTVDDMSLKDAYMEARKAGFLSDVENPEFAEVRPEGIVRIDDISKFSPNGNQVIAYDKGKLYQVELAPSEDEYLDWDKPLSEQSEKVKAAIQDVEKQRLIGIIEQRKQRREQRTEEGGDTTALDRQIEVLQEEIDAGTLDIGGDGNNYYKSLWQKLGGDREASKYLHSLGIRGIKYLDGSSRGAGEGSQNYVIFDDADVKITAKESRRASNETAPANAGVSVSAPSESVRRIQAVVERFKSQFKGASALDIRVVSTTFDIPARFRPSPFAEGVFHDDAGLVYLVTMNLHNPRGELSENRAWQVLLHESVGHYGLSQMMGDKFASILKAVKQATHTKGRVTDDSSDTFKPGDKDYATWDAVKLRYPKASDAEIAQEVLARMAETDPGSSIVGYAVAVVRQWVREMARAMGINLAVSTSELRDLVAKASGYMRRGDNLAEERVPSGLVAASTGVAREGGKRGLESRAATGKPQGPIWSAPEMSRTDNIIYTMQDKNIDLKRVQQAIKEAVGEIRDDIDAYLQEELFHGRAAKITEEFLDKEVNPLISLMRASNVSMEELETFLWARHAKERNAQIAKINEAMPDGGSGLTNKQADDIMAGKDVKIGDKTIAGVKPARKKLLSDLAGRVDAITRGNRALLERYSLESADTLNAWDGAYKHYVPLHREDAESHLAGMGTGQGYSVKGSSSKRATGSSRPVENILANLALQRERIITRGEKNRVAQSLYGLAKEMPNADLWEVDVKPTMRTTAMIGGREQVVDAIDPAFRSKPNVVFARFNGEDRFVVFNEHNERALRMAEALKNLDADDISHLLGEVSRWTRYFASINTQYNPIFGVTNLVRDVQTGLLNLKSTPIAGKQKEMMGHLVQALPAVFKALRAGRKGQAATGTWAQLWEEFQEIGGQTGYRNMFRNGQERAEALQNALDPTWWQKTWWGKAATVGGVLAVPEQAFLDKFGKPFMELLSDYNTMMENGIRLSAYKVALDSGMTKERAASLAKNLTVNFNRKGQAARQVGSLYAFFNASVQGTARMAETLNHGAKPGELLGKAGKQIVYGGLLLGAVQAMLLMAAGFDDEEPPEFVRDRNIIIPTGNGKYVSIPMPLGFHVLPAISRISIEFTAGGFKKPGEHLVHIMDVLLDSFNPIGNAGLSMQTVAPTVLDPIAALTENKDWSGRQIARQDFSKLNPTPGYTRAKDTASSLSRGLAYAFNYLSGGGEYGIGIVSPTPDQIDYLLGQLTGGVGRELGKVLTTGEAMATGEDLPPHKIPLVGRFYGDTTGQSSEASKFYGTLEKLSEHKGTLDRMKDAHDVEAYREYAKEHPEIRFYDRANKVQRELSSLRKLKRKMIERDADRAKVRQIEDRMRTLMTRFNQSVSEQKGDH